MILANHENGREAGKDVKNAAKSLVYLTGWSLSILVMAVQVVAAEDSPPTLDELTRFHTDCAPVHVSIVVDEDSRRLNVVNAEYLQDMVATRLEVARLRDFSSYSKPWAQFSVQVNGLEGETTNAFTVDVEFYRSMVTTGKGGFPVSVPVWRELRFGYFRRQAANSQPANHTFVSDMLDAFILQYLRINKDACDPTPTRASEKR